MVFYSTTNDMGLPFQTCPYFAGVVAPFFPGVLFSDGHSPRIGLPCLAYIPGFFSSHVRLFPDPSSSYFFFSSSLLPPPFLPPYGPRPSKHKPVAG